MSKDNKDYERKSVGIKILGLISQISASEVDRFKSYLKSEFFIPDLHDQKIMGILFDMFYEHLKTQLSIIKNGKDISIQPLMKEEAERLLMTEMPNWPIQRLDKLTTDLLKKVLNFLAIKGFQRKEMEKQLFMLEEMNRERMREIFIQFWNQTERQLLKEYHNDRFLLNYYKLEEEKVIYLANMGERFPQVHQEKAMERLEKFYHARKLKLLISQLNQSRILDTEFSSKDVNGFIKKCKKYWKNDPYIGIYLSAYCTLISKSEHDFEDYRQKLTDLGEKFDYQELRDLYAIALNFSNQLYQKNGSFEYLEKHFLLYKEVISTGILLDGSDQDRRYLSVLNFKNIIKIAITLDKVDWAKDFIQKSEHLLLPEDRTAAINYAMALLSLAEMEYKQSISQMEKVLNATKDLFFQIDARIQQLKAWYLLNDDNEDHVVTIQSYQDAVRMYIARNKKTSKHHQERFKNFIKFYVKLWRPRYKKQEPLKNLIQEIKNEKQVAEKSWLLKMAENKLADLGIG